MEATQRPGPSPDVQHRRSRIGPRHVLLMAAVLAATALSAAIPAPTRADEGGVPIVPVADTWAKRLNPEANYGSSPELRVRDSRAQTYVKFDLSEWYGQQVSRMELQVSVTSGPASPLRLRLTDVVWSELALNWTTQPALLSSPTASTATDSGTAPSTSAGSTTFNVLPYFAQGQVDRRTLSIRLTSSSYRITRIASRETSHPPRLVVWGSDGSSDVVTEPASTQPSTLRFYTPNIIARGDPGNPPRDTDAAQMAALFQSSSDMAPVLNKVDVYSFFGSSLGRGDPAYDAMVKRAIPMLASRGVKLGLEVGGPLGYNPGAVYGGDTNGENGRKSALFDLKTRVAKIESMGGRVDYLMLDGGLRRTIRNGVHKNPHGALVTIGTAANANALTYRARAVGSQGNSIRVTYQVAGNYTPLSVVVSGTDIVVRLATDGAGQPVSRATNVKAAVEASSAASALVTVGHYAGSSGSGVVPPRAATSLAWGDDGLNMTIDQSVNELVSYIRTVNAARPNIRFVLLEDVILWPYDGKPGYASIPVSQQRPDFKVAWDKLVASLRSAGLLKLLVGFHNDAPVEYFEGTISSIHRDSDDWYGRMFKQQAQVEASGVAFGQLFNSVHGGTPSLSRLASGSYFQSQVLHHVSQVEKYRQAKRPNMARMEHFVIDAFMYHPRIVTPSTEPYSTDATYLKALQRFMSGGVSMTRSLIAMERLPAISIGALREQVPAFDYWRRLAG